MNGNKGITIGDNQYPAAIFTIWTESERNAIGIYTIEIDNTNLKDEDWYINTSITYAFGSGKVTGTYGTATAKSLADVNFTQADQDAGLGTKDELNYRGLTYTHKERVSHQAYTLLLPSDWYAARKAETGTAIPSTIATYRAAVRTKAADMHTKIDAADTVDKLAALYVYSGDPLARPLGEWPDPVE